MDFRFKYHHDGNWVWHFCHAWTPSKLRYSGTTVSGNLRWWGRGRMPRLRNWSRKHFTPRTASGKNARQPMELLNSLLFSSKHTFEWIKVNNRALTIFPCLEDFGLRVRWCKWFRCCPAAWGNKEKLWRPYMFNTTNSLNFRSSCSCSDILLDAYHALTRNLTLNHSPWYK